MSICCYGFPDDLTGALSTFYSLSSISVVQGFNVWYIRDLDKRSCVGSTLILCLANLCALVQGWGAVAAEMIPRGKFVCLYAGEVIGSSEAARRLVSYDKDGVGHALLVRSACFTPVNDFVSGLVASEYVTITHGLCSTLSPV